MYKPSLALSGAFVALLLLTGCKPSADVTPTSNVSSPGQNTGATGTADVGGSTTIGALGDPCTLLTVAEVESATGHHVIAVSRGEPRTDGSSPASQTCVWVTDGPASTSMTGLIGAFGGDASAVETLSTTGGPVGITLTQADTTSGSTDSGTPDPNNPVQIVMVPALGPDAAVVVLPEGGAGFAAGSGSKVVMLMVLLGETFTADQLTSLLSPAVGRLG